MKRTKDLRIREKLSQKRQKLRQTIDSLRVSLENLEKRAVFAPGQQSLRQRQAERLQAEIAAAERELRDTLRGSKAQLTAGWY